ncbi:MAG: cation-transporting P-type ATPase [Syntrophobacterales bacterium]|nr:cation-transporting P-type ATPase [Syntrophobacterales bacterium]
MSIQALTREEALKALASRDTGLTAAEARRRLEEYGPNEIREVRRTPLWRRFLAQFSHFLAVLLWIAAFLCFLSAYFQPEEGLGRLGWAIIGVILVNALFTFIQEYRAERTLAALKGLLPFNVTVRREGALTTIPAREVVPGDILLLEAGDKVPADARLLTASRLMVNLAPLTGESAPVARNAEPFPGEYLDSPNLVFAGTLVVNGSGEAVAVATGMATEFGKIAHLTAGVEPGLSPLQRELARLTRVVAVIALILGLGFFALGVAIGRGFWQNFLFAVGIIVANVPEGLLPTVTLSLALGSQRLARKKALVKNLNAVETLGSVEVICSDKTGTLTENRMQVQEMWLPPGAGSGPQFGHRLLLTIAGLCNNAVLTGGGYQGDPTEVALLQAVRELQADLTGERLREVPFDADRKRMSTVHRVQGETLVLTKGALETVLPRCSRVILGPEAVPLTEAQRQEIQTACEGLMDRGLRVMAFAFRPLAPEEQAALPPDEVLESRLSFVGLMGLADPVRPEVPQAVATCQAAGIRVLMVTGDAGRTALAVARQVGLAGEQTRVMEGPELEALSDEELKDRLRQGEPVFARMTPRHKLRVVTALQEMGLRVAVTGDGVNDAPALRQADIGVAMGLIGTDVAREAADLVLLDDNFATMVAAVAEGRAIFENIRKFIIYIFAHLTPEVVPYVLYSFLPLPLPLTVMQILAIDLGTETLPALALGVERVEPALMRRPPRSGPLLDWEVFFRGYVFLGLSSCLGVLFAYFTVLHAGGWSWGQVLPLEDPLARQAATATFLGIVLMQVANVLACRSSLESLRSIGLFSNRLLWAGIVLELLLAAFLIYHPWGQEIFDTAPLPGWVWLTLVPFAALILLLEEGRKFRRRRAAAGG